MSTTLFDVPGPDYQRRDGKPSADQRRTQRRNFMLRRGFHPATRLRLLNKEWGFTCGDCRHECMVSGGARNYHKCLKAGVSSSAASDIRVSWPACEAFSMDGES